MSLAAVVHRQWRDLPFAQKLALLLIALVSLPIIVVVAYATYESREALLISTRARNLERARGTAEVIDAYFSDKRADVRTAASLSAVVDFCSGPRAPAAHARVLRSLLAVRDEQQFLAMYLTDRFGRVLATTDGRVIAGSYQTGRAFLAAMAGTTVVDDPAYEPFDERVALRVSHAVRTGEGEVVGTVVGLIDVVALDELTRRDANYSGLSEFSVLWTGPGIRLSDSSDPALRFSAWAPMPPDTAVVMAQRLGPLYSSGSKLDPALAPIADRGAWLLYDAGTEPHLRVTTGQYGPLQMTAVPLRGQRWVYGIFVPEERILATLRQQMARDWSVAFFTVLAALALSLIAARWVTKPLRRVTDAANALAAGEMQRRVGLAQRDEVGQVGDAFDAMASALAEKERELQAHAAQLERRVEERTATLQELAAANALLLQEAQEANRMKDEFLGVVSHELRTPLNAIMGWTRLAAMPEQAGIEPHKAIAAVERNAHALARLVDDLLDVPRILTGKLALERRPVDLVAVVTEAVDAIRPSAESKSVAVSFHPEVAAAPMDGDAHRLQQVFWNVLSNAVKFTPAGGRITARLTRTSEQVVVTVEDTGIGIQEDFLPFVFERFRQADSSTSRAHGGLGIGLSLAHHLVRMHGGSVTAASAGPGQGSTFTVYLPVISTEVTIPDPPAADAHAGDGERLRRIRVLVIDDDQDSREIAARLLGAAGASVTAAATVEEGFNTLARHPGGFDAVLADIGMPGQDGYAFIAGLRGSADARLRTLPAVAVTAYASRGDRARALAAGFDEHVTKPVSEATLIDALVQVVSRTVGD